MSDVIVCRLKYRVLAAAPEPLCRRQRAYRGFSSLCRRFMRAILDAARIPIRRERDSACRAICADAVVPAGADGRRRRQTIAVRQLNFCRPFEASGGLFHALLNVCQDAKRGLSKKFPGVSFGAAHDGQSSEGSHHERGKESQGRGKFGHG